MISVNYDSMSLSELRKYVLDNRENIEAFQVYIERSKASGRMVTLDFNDPNWEDKITAAINNSSI